MVSYCIVLFVVATIIPKVQSYCLPKNVTCWPSDEKWEELKAKITGNKLHDLSDVKKYDQICKAAGKDAYVLEDQGEGRCMQYHDCSKKECDESGTWNIPAVSVEVSNENDIIEALKFAKTHNIQVVVKTSGHNYAGASMGYGALLIWMRNYQTYGDVIKNYKSCDKTYEAALKIGGGQIWLEAYTAVGNDYHLIGGGGLTVSAAGGWLMGGGLSASARLYGMGVDQVIDMEVITADGTKYVANECENTDLFWALRGGGGGTFGVVTAVHYKLHPVKPFCELAFSVTDFTEPNYDTTTVLKWIDYLVDEAPDMSTKYGGYWGFNFGIFYYEGTEEEVKADSFYKGLMKLGNIGHTLKCDISYYSLRGLPNNKNTDETGSDTFNIASRLIPEDFVRNKPDEMKEIFRYLVFNGYLTFNYIIGGKMQEVGASDTAVHPAMRKSIFQMETFGEQMIQKLREKFPDSGVGFNHAAKNEPNWDHEAWGSNLARLKEIKKKYDPDNLFNCYHCLGYKNVDSSCSMYMSVSVLAFLAMLYAIF